MKFTIEELNQLKLRLNSDGTLLTSNVNSYFVLNEINIKQLFS